MNIQTVSRYAEQGYKIYRVAWIDANTKEISKSISTIKEKDNETSFFWSGSDLGAILSPEDCIADDWEIIFNYV